MATVASCKKLIRSKSGLRIVFSDLNLRSPFELEEPNWSPDKESPDCSKCNVKFDFLTRRHHCRRCGLVYCNRCCVQKLALPRMCFVDPVRLCNSCTKSTQKENDFYETHLKALTSGANFILESDLFNKDSSETKFFFSRLSCNHREILFDGGSQIHHQAVPLHCILSTKIIKSEDFKIENEIGGVELLYTLGDEKLNLILTVPSVPNPKQSAAWITALRKALYMLKEALQDKTVN